MPRLINKKAIIVGGNRGIGRGIALAYAKEGADLVITYHEGEKEADEVVKEIQAIAAVKVKAIKIDITDEKDRLRAIAESFKFLEEVHILVNCAGVCIRSDFLRASEKSYDQTMAVNIKGPYFFTQQVCIRMREQGKGGSVINISSSRDEGGMSNISLYASSKAAFSIFSRCIALELAQFGIRVNTIAPGLTQTDMHRDTWEKNSQQWQKRVAEIPIGRAGIAEDIAPLAVYLASDESSYVTGSRFLIDGGRALGAPPP